MGQPSISWTFVDVLLTSSPIKVIKGSVFPHHSQSNANNPVEAVISVMKRFFFQNSLVGVSSFDYFIKKQKRKANK